jgi:hypothetical protein
MNAVTEKHQRAKIAPATTTPTVSDFDTAIDSDSKQAYM